LATLLQEKHDGAAPPTGLAILATGIALALANSIPGMSRPKLFG